MAAVVLVNEVLGDPDDACRGLGYWPVDGPAMGVGAGFELDGGIDVEDVGEAFEDGQGRRCAP
jgi:hypothetical protein